MVIKLKNSNGDKTKKIKCDQTHIVPVVTEVTVVTVMTKKTFFFTSKFVRINSTTQIVMKLKNSNCDNTKNSNCD